MEIILAIVVIIAVIFLGALISLGNERQRRAIDNLREQTVLWAMQDLRIKREKLTIDVRVNDPLGWFNKIASKVSGLNLNVQFVEAFDEPRALIFASGNGGDKVVFSPLSPEKVRRVQRDKHNRLFQFADRNPLLSLSRTVSAYELSVLNCGNLFDLELPLAWKGLTGQEAYQIERLWIYVI